MFLATLCQRFFILPAVIVLFSCLISKKNFQVLQLYLPIEISEVWTTCSPLIDLKYTLQHVLLKYCMEKTESSCCTTSKKLQHPYNIRQHCSLPNSMYIMNKEERKPLNTCREYDFEHYCSFHSYSSNNRILGLWSDLVKCHIFIKPLIFYPTFLFLFYQLSQ